MAGLQQLTGLVQCRLKVWHLLQPQGCAHQLLAHGFRLRTFTLGTLVGLGDRRSRQRLQLIHFPLFCLQ